MSCDLEVVTHLKPEQRHLGLFLASQPALSVDRQFGAVDGNVVVSRKSRVSVAASFIVDGPLHIESEDLAEILTATVLAPRWLLQISVSATSPVDVSLAKRFAKVIAQQCQGAVYDPQEDGVLWPSGKRKRYTAPRGTQDRITVEVQWFLPSSQASADVAKKWFSILERHCPEALPTRFGFYEPFQGRCEPGSYEPFYEAWERGRGSEIGDMLFFRSCTPCEGGFAAFPDWREKFRPARVGRAVHLNLSFWQRALLSDVRWADSVADLCIEVARKLGAFYAMSHIWRDSSTLIGPWWQGISPAPTWLAWFGRPYKRHVAKALTGFDTLDTEQGVFLRAARQPLKAAELRGVFPSLPRRLMVKVGDDKDRRADFIPPIH